VPGLAFAGFVMTEVAFYPVICLVAWAMARALERPTAARQALAVAGIGLAAATRLQAIVLVPALVLAILIKAALDRTWLQGVRRFAPLAGSLVALVAAGVAVKLARGGSALGSVLGAYKITGHVSYGFGDALRRGLPRPRIATALTSLGALGLLLYLPWDRFVTAAAEPDAFSVIPLYRLRVSYPGLDTRLVVAIGAVELLALVAFLPRRHAWPLPLVLFAL